MPPYWLRQRWNVCSEISRCRATSSTVLPWAKSLSASASLRITCSGVCRRFFICAVLPAPSWGIGLAQRVDQFKGTRSAIYDAVNSYEPGTQPDFYLGLAEEVRAETV